MKRKLIETAQEELIKIMFTFGEDMCAYIYLNSDLE